jgi:hypothetical protein
MHTGGLGKYDFILAGRQVTQPNNAVAGDGATADGEKLVIGIECHSERRFLEFVRAT